MNGRRCVWWPRVAVAPDADWATYSSHDIGDPDMMWSRRRCLACSVVGGVRLQAAPCPGDRL